MILHIGNHTYLLKTGFLWGPVLGFPADVADNSNTIRFYHRKDLDKVLKDPESLQKLLASAKESRKKIPFAKPGMGSEWILEVDEFKTTVSDSLKKTEPLKIFNQDPLRGQGLAEPTKEGLQ